MVGVPPYSFNGNLNTGIYQDVNNGFAFTANGVRAGGFSPTGAFDLVSGISIVGSVTGYAGDELKFAGATGTETGISDLGTSRNMIFDHRGAGTATSWTWRNNLGGTVQMSLSGVGLLTVTGGVGLWAHAAPASQPTGTPAASTDLASVIALANSLRTSILGCGLAA